MNKTFIFGLSLVVLFVAFLAALCVVTDPAWPQERISLCAPHERMQRTLAAAYGERPVATGQIDEGRTAEFYMSTDRTWTLVITGADGQSCMVAAGSGWERSRPVLLGEET